jgi:hypothetical protein
MHKRIILLSQWDGAFRNFKYKTMGTDFYQVSIFNNKRATYAPPIQ